MSTCLNTHMLLCSHFLTFTYFYVHMLWWSHTHLLYDFELIHENINSYEHQSLKHFKIGALKIMLECWDDWVIWGMCTLVLKCSYECTLSWSHALLITYSRLSLLWWLNVHMSTCFGDHMLLCSHALMFTRFDDHMLLCLHALMITCPLTFMPLFSYA